MVGRYTFEERGRDLMGVCLLQDRHFCKRSEFHYLDSDLDSGPKAYSESESLTSAYSVKHIYRLNYFLYLFFPKLRVDR
jgi:hypothetical protein